MTEKRKDKKLTPPLHPMVVKADQFEMGGDGQKLFNQKGFENKDFTFSKNDLLDTICELLPDEWGSEIERK